MTSTFTNNSGIQKPADGEQSGIWGDSVNADFDIIDAALHGVFELGLSGSSYTLTTPSSGALSSNGSQYRTLVLTGSPTGSLGTPFALTIAGSSSTIQKLQVFHNKTSAYINVQQGAGTTKALIYPNKTAIVYIDGAGNAFDISSAFNVLSLAGGTVTGTTNFTSTVGIGSASPATTLELKADDTFVAQFSAYIVGTDMTVTGVASGTLASGYYIFGAGVQTNTYITSGSGGAGAYVVSASQTVASSGSPITMYAIEATKNRIRFTDSDTTAVAGQPIGTIEFYGSDASTPGAGVSAYIAAVAETTTPDTALVFGTRNNVAGTVSATEDMRLTSDGYLGVGIIAPTAPVHVALAGAGDALIVESTDAGATDAPDVVFYRNSASPAASDVLGDLVFRGKNSAAASIDYAKIVSRATSVTSTSEVGGLFLQTTVGSTLSDRMAILNTGVGIGTTAPATALEISGSTNEVSTLTGYIWDGVTAGTAGTTLTVSAGTPVIGQYIYGDTVAANTYIVSGSGATWTVSTSQLVGLAASQKTIYTVSPQTNRIRVTDTDTDIRANQPIGTVEFYTNDASTPGAGVGAFVSAVSVSGTPDVDLIFGTRDNPAVGVGAAERMRISQTLISYTIPQAIAGASTLAASASITTTATSDGTKTAYESYTLTPIGGNMRYLTNNVGTVATTAASGTGSTATITFGTAFVTPVGSSITVSGVTPTGYNGTYTVTASSAGSVSFASSTTGSQTIAGTVTSGINLAAPSASGDYTMVLQITNGASAGNISFSGFNKTTGSQFTRTNGDDFMVYVTKLNGFTVANVVALQ